MQVPIKELAIAGISDVASANQFIREVYLARHNQRFAVKPEQEGSAFVPVIGSLWRDVLCVQDERQAGNDNTVQYGRRVLQPPPTPERAHYVRASVRAHEYPDGPLAALARWRSGLAIFHGPRRLADYTPDGSLITPNGEPKTSQQAA